MSISPSALLKTLAGNLSWTAASLVILGVSGIAINLIIAGARGASDLGVFNQAYAVYVVASQLTVFGIHNSIMRNAAHYSGDAAEGRRLAGSGLLLSVFTGVIGAGLLMLLSPLLGRWFDSPETALSVRNVAYGLVFFPLSKTLLGLLNGLQLMKAFAALQSLRYIVVMAWVAAVSLTSASIDKVLYCFLAAEILTSVGALVYLWSNRLMQEMQVDLTWIGRHASFGARSLLSNTFVELNSRIDIILIGFFLTDRDAGIYSFGAILIDGLYQVWHLIRVNLNPILVNANRDRDWDTCRMLMSKSRRYLYPLAVVLALGVVFAYWLATAYLMPGKGLEEGMLPLVILLVGLTVVAPFIPFDQLPLLGGYPGLQTLQQLSVVVVNAILNVILIPWLGIVGAALGTALSYVVGVFVLTLMVRRLYSWNLIANRIEA